MPPTDTAGRPQDQRPQRSRPGRDRSPAGAAWRGAAVLVVTVAGIALSAWLGSRLITYDTRLVTGPTAPAALAIGALVGAWLRAGNSFVVTSVLSSLVGAQAIAYLLNDGLIDALRHHLAPSGFTVFEQCLAGAGVAVALVSVIRATAGGYRNPREPKAAGRPGVRRG